MLVICRVSAACTDCYLCSEQVNRGDVILFLVHWHERLLPRSCTGFSILHHGVLTLQTKSNRFSLTQNHIYSMPTCVGIYMSMCIWLFSFIHIFHLPVVWHRGTPVSHQPSWVPGPEGRPQCCTRPWDQTALQRGPDASGRCRSPPQWEHTVLRSLCQPAHTQWDVL